MTKSKKKAKNPKMSHPDTLRRPTWSESNDRVVHKYVHNVDRQRQSRMTSNVQTLLGNHPQHERYPRIRRSKIKPYTDLEPEILTAVKNMQKRLKKIGRQGGRKELLARKYHPDDNLHVGEVSLYGGNIKVGRDGSLDY